MQGAGFAVLSFCTNESCTKVWRVPGPRVSDVKSDRSVLACVDPQARLVPGCPRPVELPLEL